MDKVSYLDWFDVSTHSRPKAAAVLSGCYQPQVLFQHTAARRRLLFPVLLASLSCRFQHTAARRRLLDVYNRDFCFDTFQHTAARRRLFLYLIQMRCGDGDTFQHTAARRRLIQFNIGIILRSCFNTQPPEGGCRLSSDGLYTNMVSTHSRPKAAGKRA